MFKSVLYYILSGAILFFSTMFGFIIACLLFDMKHPFVAGVEDGYAGNPYGTSIDQSFETLLNGSSTFAILFYFCIAMILVIVFLRAKFAKFTWGILPQQDRMKTVLFSILPALGLTWLVHGLGRILGASVIMPDFQVRSGWGDILLNVIDWVPTALIFYGAIMRELLACRKKPWVIYLTFFIFYIPVSNTLECLVTTGSESYLFVGLTMDLLPIFYFTWLYQRTRSVNLVMIVGILSYIVPYTAYNDVTQWIFLVLGLLFIVLSWKPLMRMLKS